MSSHPAFEQTDHRPWPLPTSRWKWRQQWNDLAFIHWEVDAQWLRSVIPPDLDLDLHDGKAWIGIVPFTMEGVTRRGFPAPRFMCDFPELNVRTYVTKDDKPGVWFFSLDITNRFAVWVARTFFHLPYFSAEMEVSEEGDGIRYRSSRDGTLFDATYIPGEARAFESGSFEIWATERYCLYSKSNSGVLYRGEVHHKQWSLQLAKFEIRSNSLLEGIPVGAMHPSILFSKSIDVVVYDLEKIGSSETAWGAE